MEFLNQIKLFYLLKPTIPRRIQLCLRRLLIKHRRRKYVGIWPIDKKAGQIPQNWTGWPDGKKFAFILTHDVDTQAGHDKCHNLMELEMKLGFRSSFNFVPEKYQNSESLKNELRQNGFEIGIHGLNHDGKLYRSRKIFIERAKKINNYLKTWQAEGFRSPAMHHNLDWIHDLDILYDASTFDTDPFEPQPDGARTIFPFYIQNNNRISSYIELPYTLPQDFTLFILMREKTIDIWKKKLNWIAEKGGMVLLNAHPDYMSFDEKTLGLEEYPFMYYFEFLEWVKSQYEGQYWNVLPKQVARHMQTD